MSPLKRPSASAAGWAPASRRSASTLGGCDDAEAMHAGASSDDEEAGAELFDGDGGGGGGLQGGASTCGAGGAAAVGGHAASHCAAHVSEEEPAASGAADDGGGHEDARSCGSVEPWVELVVLPQRPARRPDFMLAPQRPHGGGRKRGASTARSDTGDGAEQPAAKRARAGALPGSSATAVSTRHAGTCTSQDREAHSNDVELLQRSVATARGELERAAFVNDALLATLDAVRAKFNGRLVALEAAHRDELATLRTQHAIAVALQLDAAAAPSGR